MKGRKNMKHLQKLAVGTAWAWPCSPDRRAPQNVKIGLVVKSLGNGFFEAANKGAQEAAKELGDVEMIYTGPTTTTAEGQIEVINALIAQRVDAIAISANDPDARRSGAEEGACSAASRSSPGIPASPRTAASCTSTRRPTS